MLVVDTLISKIKSQKKQNNSLKVSREKGRTSILYSATPSKYEDIFGYSRMQKIFHSHTTFEKINKIV